MCAELLVHEQEGHNLITAHFRKLKLGVSEVE